MARRNSLYPAYVVNGLVLLGNGTPIGDFRGTWNWDGTPEGFSELQEQTTQDLARKHRMDAQLIRICITAFVLCPAISQDSRA